MPESTKTYVLNDKPVESLRDDALDFTPYVQSLADIIVTGSTPLTIGVFGTWGSGKTSLMRMVQEQVEVQGAVTGWFDAWKYNKDETLWRAFLLAALLAVRKSIKEGMPTDALDYLETMLYRAIDLEKAGGVTIDLTKLGGKLAQGAVQIGLSFLPGGAALGKIVEELQKSGTENLSQGALDAIQRERSKFHIEQVRFLEQFQDKFHALVQQYVVNNGRRLVVFVDDLDRCLPEKAIEVLESIKLFVDAPGCIFVLGLDQEVIARDVELRYHEFFKSGEQKPIDGAKYLEKIIQLPFQIPPVEQDNIGGFVQKLISNWPDDECPRVFSEGLKDNPRQIKRTINVFLMLWQLAERRKDKLRGEIKPIRLAKVVAIQALYPDLYRLLKETPRYLRELEEYYSVDTAIPTSRRQAHEVRDGRSQKNIEISPVLNNFVHRSALRRILTMHKPEMLEANFLRLSGDEISVYLAQLRRVEHLQMVRTSVEFLEPQTILIPAGKFLMGSTFEQVEQAIKDGLDRDWGSVECPQHEIELSEYFIGKYPVTNREYQVFLRATNYKSPDGWEGDKYPMGKGDYPVVSVSWNDAKIYCDWLSMETNKLYRLPTEAEWEKAARGVDGRIWPWGNEFGENRANTNERGIGDITPVGQFSPAGDSVYGCVDMVGNVWEWCKDVFNETEYANRKDKVVQNPEYSSQSGVRVLRGGSYLNGRSGNRCASRNWSSSDECYEDWGFRVAHSLQ